MRAIPATFLTAAFLTLGMLATPAISQARDVEMSATSPTGVSARAKRRARVYIYRNSDERGVIPSFFPGSDAVRDCTATYAQEFRASGTVIVPRMSCYWRRP